MSTSIVELTDKIYQDGILKAQDEARLIIEKAKGEAEQIISRAKSIAEKIKQDGEASIAESKKNMRSEMQLYTKQTVAALQTEITNLLTGEITSSSVKAATADKDFMQKIILELVKSWGSDQKLEIRATEADKLTKYFVANAKDLLDKKVKIEQVNNIKTSFEIQPENEDYKISFGEDELIAYFKEFLRPQLIKTLFA